MLERRSERPGGGDHIEIQVPEESECLLMLGKEWGGRC